MFANMRIPLNIPVSLSLSLSLSRSPRRWKRRWRMQMRWRMQSQRDSSASVKGPAAGIGRSRVRVHLPSQDETVTSCERVKYIIHHMFRIQNIRSPAPLSLSPERSLRAGEQVLPECQQRAHAALPLRLRGALSESNQLWLV